MIRSLSVTLPPLLRVEKLNALGKSIGTIQKHFDELSGTRARQLEKPMEKITELQLGKGDRLVDPNK